MSRPWKIPGLPQTKNLSYDTSFSKQLWIAFALGDAGSRLQRTPGSRDGSAVLLYRVEDKHHPTTGESPKLIHLFHSPGPLGATQGGRVVCRAISCHLHCKPLIPGSRNRENVGMRE